MSLSAMVWAWNLAYVPPSKPKDGSPTLPGARPSSAAAAVLVALADAADDDGRNAFPGVELITIRTRLSERAVRYALDLLEEEGVIRPAASTRVRDARIARPDRRPAAYDLVFDRYRDDLTDEQLARMARNPMLAPHVEALRVAVAPGIEPTT